MKNQNGYPRVLCSSSSTNDKNVIRYRYKNDTIKNRNNNNEKYH